MADEPRPEPLRRTVEPEHRLQDIVDDEPGQLLLGIIRKVGRRETVIEVPLTEVEAARLIEQLGGALRREAAVRITRRVLGG